MSAEKKERRARFRRQVFARAGNVCQAREVGQRCGLGAADAHHIVSRDVAPGGGYDPSNGIALCPAHHLDAERGRWTPETLREWIDVRPRRGGT